MFNRQLTVAGVVLLFVIGLFAIISFRQEAQTTKPQQEEATVVQKGQITEKEHEYSKEYKKLYSYRNGYKLSELSAAAKRNGNGEEVGVSIGEPSIPTVGTSFPVKGSSASKQFLEKISCKADAVVLGTVSGKTAHLTEDETFVYTQYQFSVKQVLKNNSDSFIDENTSLEVTRPGGLIKLDNQLIRVEDQSYKPLQNNKDYLLFLKFIPDVNGYMVSDISGDFVLENKSFKQLRKTIFSEELEKINDSQVFLDNIKIAVSDGCSQQIKGVN
jgi:hypothetical protein